MRWLCLRFFPRSLCYFVLRCAVLCVLSMFIDDNLSNLNHAFWDAQITRSIKPNEKKKILNAATKLAATLRKFKKNSKNCNNYNNISNSANLSYLMFVAAAAALRIFQRCFFSVGLWLLKLSGSC